MRESYPYDKDLHQEGSTAAQGRCSHHAGGSDQGGCAGEAVVSFKDEHDQWQSGCSAALEQLVEDGQIAPLGQGA